MKVTKHRRVNTLFGGELPAGGRICHDGAGYKPLFIYNSHTNHSLRPKNRWVLVAFFILLGIILI